MRLGTSWEAEKRDPGNEVASRMNMADDRVLQRALTDFATSGPGFCLIKLEKYSFPVVGSSFSGTSFLMDYYEDALCGVEFHRKIGY